MRQVLGGIAVDQQIHLYAPLGGFDQALGNVVARFIIIENIGLKVEAMGGCGNELFQQGKIVSTSPNQSGPIAG